MSKQQVTGENRNKKQPMLKKGESAHSNKGYQYRWTDKNGKRHSVYAIELSDLREKEKEIARDQRDNVRPEGRVITLNEMFNLWVQVKRGIRDTTLRNYKYMYNMFVAPYFGKQRISIIVKSDVKRFYNSLIEDKGLSVSTLDGIHNVLHQVFGLAVDDDYIRRNPTDNVLKELMQAYTVRSEKRRALTKDEQDLFLSFLRKSPEYRHWYPIFAIMIGTGLRVGEATGLRWCDIDLVDGMIDVNHTLIYYKRETDGVYFNIHSPKTQNSIRTVPMLDFVREAFLMEKQYQEENNLHCSMTVDGFTDFIFVNRFGQIQHYGTLNKALNRIIRDCNDEILTKGTADQVLLPHFSCHSLRHTFATRMCEQGVNIKVIQDILGHADVTTTLNIYADATKDLKKKEFIDLNKAFAAEK